ncbi:TAXI family TRAP transporter solute-binding subunit [Rhodoferax sediminis]|uniref:C4-dicarboxylate ABC transporter substrate-binding protein n=1 Tax=Rhodoferax sediminis TaxID=2509614 RepID=A0A515DDA5_9BURK|nr:TAXI family TRAP transporter solute-binding subunit [Rhodoferax sediminis]QDL38387.1 C4-dicarboxylate ABC transporter substrate-binding protein [Rhodoferax sediminis]
MPQAMRHTLLSLRDLLVSAGPFVLLTVALLAFAYWWLNPNPPRHVTLATGPAQSAYDEFGKRYKAALAVNGIDVTLLPSEGSAANLQLLRDGKADLGFVQGGSGDAQGDTQSALSSLGSLFVEPIWLFYREDAARKVPGTTDATLSNLAQLAGLRVNVGTQGSGVPALMDKLLQANRIDPKSIQLSQLAQTPATVAFLGGDLDAIVFVSAPEALMVQMLLQTPGVKLMNFAQSEAYSRRFAFLTPVVLPRGVVDLAGDVPPQNVRLVATTTTLLAREDTHPALLQLFSQAAQTLHSGAGWFNRAHEFPNANNTEYPLARPADRTLRNGAPLLQRYLPFWLANLVERMWLALGIIVAVLLPLSRIVPPLYQFRIRSRVFRWYGRLREIEHQLELEPASSPALVDELNTLERHVGKVSIPLSYADELYALRDHIEMVRKKLLKT